MKFDIKLDKLNITDELERLEIPYRFSYYDPNVTTIGGVCKDTGLKPEQIIKILVLKAGEKYLLVLIPQSKRIDWGRIKKFTGESTLTIATEQEIIEVTGHDSKTLTIVGSKLRTYADSGIMRNQFLGFGTGVRGIELVLDKNDLVRAFQVTLGHFTKDFDE